MVEMLLLLSVTVQIFVMLLQCPHYTSPNVLIHCGGVQRSLCQHAVELTLELHQHQVCLTEYCILSTYFFNYSSVEGVLKTLVKSCRP